MKKRFIGLCMLVLGVISFAGCGSSLNIVGMWEDVDGEIRIFNEDGTCQNIEPIDIGGPAAIYNISSKESDGYYTLNVSQSGMIQMYLSVKMIDKNHIEIYEDINNGPLYVLERQ